MQVSAVAENFVWIKLLNDFLLLSNFSNVKLVVHKAFQVTDMELCGFPFLVMVFSCKTRQVRHNNKCLRSHELFYGFSTMQ